MKIEHYNNYPEGFLEDFTEPVTFRSTAIKKDPDNKNGVLMSAVSNVPATSKVNFTGPDGKKQVVHLAYISNVSPDGEIELDIMGLWLGMMNNGEIHLDPNNPKDVDKFNYLNHCHFNKNSPYTYNGAKWKIERYSLEDIAKVELNDKADVLKAVTTTFLLTDEEIVTIYGQIGKLNPNVASISEMKNELQVIAQEKPIQITKLIPARVQSIINASQTSVVPTSLTPPLGETEGLAGKSDGLVLPEENDVCPDPALVDNEDAEVAKIEYVGPDATLDVPALVATAINNGAIKKVNSKKEWRSHSGEIISTFFKLADGKGTAEEQLTDSLEADFALASKVNFIVSQQGK